MRAVIQRVSSASVSIDNEVVSHIGAGLVVLAAVGRDDTDADAEYIVEKTVHLRVFPDAEGRFDRSVVDVGGSLLVVSQFTLYGDVRRGRRPSFTEAAPPAEAEERFAALVERFRVTGVPVENRTIPGDDGCRAGERRPRHADTGLGGPPPPPALALVLPARA